MNEQSTQVPRSDKKVAVSLHLDADLMDQIRHLTSDPSQVIETAVRQWLRGDFQREDDLTRVWPKNPPIPPRGEWND